MRRQGGRRGSPLVGALIILASFAAAGYFWFRGGVSSQRQRITYLEDLSSRLRAETVPLKFMVVSRDGGEIRARVRMYDLAGREVAALEKAWPGSELYIDILLFPIRSGKDAGHADSWLAFPYRIFTDKLPAASGSVLFDAYDGGGFPEVLDGMDLSAGERAAVISAFAAARKSAGGGSPATEGAKGAFGSAVHEVSELSRFEVGIVYRVVCRIKGGVEIMED
jgi:hypothetical protein